MKSINFGDMVKKVVLDKIRNLLGIDTGIRAQLHKEMSNLIKKEKSIKKAILLTNDGMPVYSHGLEKGDPNQFAISLTTFLSLIKKKTESLGLDGMTSYVQIELDNGNIIIAISEAFSLASFTDKNADLTIVKTLTKNALKKFEALFE